MRGSFPADRITLGFILAGNGSVIAAAQVDDDDEVILIADSGKIIRMDLSSVRVIGRSTQGVRLINLEEGEKVVSLDSLAKESDDDEDESDVDVSGEEQQQTEMTDIEKDEDQ